MKILLDECLPLDFRHSFPGHDAHSAQWAGLKGKKNGELLRLAEAAGYDALLTVDRGITHQHSPTGRKLFDCCDSCENQPIGRPGRHGGPDSEGVGNNPTLSDTHSLIVWLIRERHSQRSRAAPTPSDRSPGKILSLVCRLRRPDAKFRNRCRRKSARLAASKPGCTNR